LGCDVPLSAARGLSYDGPVCVARGEDDEMPHEACRCIVLCIVYLGLFLSGCGGAPEITTEPLGRPSDTPPRSPEGTTMPIASPVESPSGSPVAEPFSTPTPLLSPIGGSPHPHFRRLTRLWCGRRRSPSVPTCVNHIYIRLLTLNVAYPTCGWIGQPTVSPLRKP